MNLYIVRHGQTDGNVYKIMDGIRDIDLNEKGIEQAELTRDEIKDVNFDLVICEVSKPSTGLGIEMGFVYDNNIPIYCLYEKGTNYSKSIEVVSNSIIEYDGINDFILKIKEIIKSR